MNADQLLEALLGTKEAFESALIRVREIAAGDLIIRLIEGLDKEGVLDNAERERRLSAVFGRVTSTPTDLVIIGEHGAKLSNAVLRNALTQLLPAEFRGLMFRGRQGFREELVVTANDDIHLQDEVVQLLSAEEHFAFSDVIILSIADDPATKRLLESTGFVPLRCHSLQDLDQMMATNEEICAFLVEGSFWKSLDRGEQTALITKLATFSTLGWVRLQEDGLIADNSEVTEIIRQARCQTSPPDVTELSFRDSAGLQQRELTSLGAARKRLNEGESRGLFIPGELGGLELRLLGAAMSRYSKKRRFNPGAELTQVKTKFLHGGQTGARVALVKVNDLRVPVIVKLDDKAFILDEARRFLTFIHKDNPELNPEVHLHAAAALIVFGMLPDPNAGEEQPAPTLEERLNAYWYDEMRDPAGSNDGAGLLRGFTDAARRLAAINKQKCTDKSFACRANPYLEGLKAMEAKGFDWGFEKKALDERTAAEKILADANQLAVCHGDAHTRNILIRGEQGFLIDYALSGPGHPCSDLVRLELSVYLTKFVQLGLEEDLISLQRDLSIHRLPEAELFSKNQRLLRSKTNHLCLKMCVVARDLVSEVLKEHQLPWEHYVASKVLGAWQSLQVPSLQQFLARGVIASMSS